MTAQEAPRTLEAVPAGPAPDSPLGRLRAAHTRRQRAVVRYLEIPANPGIFGRVGVVSSAASAMTTMRLAMLSFTGESQIDPDSVIDEAIDMVASSVLGLYAKAQDGTMEPVTVNDLPVKFDSSYGQAIGEPDINTPRAAVVSAFSKGEPATVDARDLITFAMEIAGADDEEPFVPGS